MGVASAIVMRISCKGFGVYLESVDDGDAEAIVEYSNDYDIASNVSEYAVPLHDRACAVVHRIREAEMRWRGRITTWR